MRINNYFPRERFRFLRSMKAPWGSGPMSGPPFTLVVADGHETTAEGRTIFFVYTDYWFGDGLFHPQDDRRAWPHKIVDAQTLTCPPRKRTADIVWAQLTQQQFRRKWEERLQNEPTEVWQSRTERWLRKLAPAGWLPPVSATAITLNSETGIRWLRQPRCTYLRETIHTPTRLNQISRFDLGESKEVVAYATCDEMLQRYLERPCQRLWFLDYAVKNHLDGIDPPGSDWNGLVKRSIYPGFPSHPFDGGGIEELDYLVRGGEASAIAQFIAERDSYRSKCQ